MQIASSFKKWSQKSSKCSLWGGLQGAQQLLVSRDPNCSFSVDFVLSKVRAWRKVFQQSASSIIFRLIYWFFPLTYLDKKYNSIIYLKRYVSSFPASWFNIFTDAPKSKNSKKVLLMQGERGRFNDFECSIFPKLSVLMPCTKKIIGKHFTDASYVLYLPSPACTTFFQSIYVCGHLHLHNYAKILRTLHWQTLKFINVHILVSVRKGRSQRDMESVSSKLSLYISSCVVVVHSRPPGSTVDIS